MSASRRTVLTALAASALAGCGGPAGLDSGGRVASAAPSAAAGSGAPVTVPRAAAPAASALTRAQVVARYGRLQPHTWGFGGPGVIRDLHTSRRVIALTFDACGGPHGSGYDQALIGFLRRREVPATLFLNSRWIDANPAVFRQLTGEPLFEIANHGTRHLPLSVTGRSAYDIRGTQNAGEVYDEVDRNQARLRRLLGVPPRLFRAGNSLQRRCRGTDRHRHGRSPRELLRQRRRGSHLHAVAGAQRRHRCPRRIHRAVPHEPPRQRHGPGYCRCCPPPGSRRVPLRPPLRRDPLTVMPEPRAAVTTRGWRLGAGTRSADASQSCGRLLFRLRGFYACPVTGRKLLTLQMFGIMRAVLRTAS